MTKTFDVTTDRYFVVVAAGASGGAPQRDEDAAWASFFRANAAALRRGEDEGTLLARTSARICSATTRRASRDADISQSRGSCGAGEWVHGIA